MQVTCCRQFTACTISCLDHATARSRFLDSSLKDWPAAFRCPVRAGHSLGGALATLAAYDIQMAFGFKNLQVYTYGAPRTGNYAFARCAIITHLLGLYILLNFAGQSSCEVLGYIMD